MLSIVLMLVLLGIAAYWRANGWILALAAIAGLALGQSGVWWIGAIVVAVVAVFSCLPPARRFGQPQQPKDNGRNIEQSSGSGFIVSSDGYILTNNHVIEGSSDVTVRLLDGRSFKARVVGSDKDTDVGVLKIAATGLTPAACAPLAPCCTS